MLLAGLVSIALVGVLFLFSGQSPRTVAADFLSALAKGDVAKLTELSSVNGKPKDEIRKEWEECIKYGRTYLFGWDITGFQQNKDGTAIVRIDVTENPGSPMSYPAHKELQMVKVDGSWKVDVPQISRDAFPYLPQ
ncbi:MAG TPA: hypothetical protein VHE55_08795 [Fimbriimonadaceae bacterium]|nr:hypothetical protein [Fimbriimonadaceae bacterium]